MSVIIVQPPVTVRHPPSGSGAGVLFRDTIVVRDAAVADLLLLPDVERLVVRFLIAQDELYDLVAGRVYSELPATKTFPAVRVSRFSGAPVTSRPLYLDEAHLQVDVWGGPRITALLIAETCRALLAARLVGVHLNPDSDTRMGVVTAVRFGELSYQPDESVPTEKSKARNRWLFTARITLHP